MATECPNGGCDRGTEHYGACSFSTPNVTPNNRKAADQRYREAHRAQRRDYMRDYMQRRRAASRDPNVSDVVERTESRLTPELSHA